MNQAIRLYQAQPEGDFKNSIAFPLAYNLILEDRVMQSRLACEFYSHAVGILFSDLPLDKRGRAQRFIQSLADKCGLYIDCYLIKEVLTLPKDENVLIQGRLELLDRNLTSVTPAMAYHIIQRIPKGPAVFVDQDFHRTLMERAKPLLDAPKLPPGSELKYVLQALDKQIEAEGKKLCDKYGKVEYKPAPPPLLELPGTD